MGKRTFKNKRGGEYVGDMALFKALDTRNLGGVIKALDMGANPNAVFTINDYKYLEGKGEYLEGQGGVDIDRNALESALFMHRNPNPDDLPIAYALIKAGAGLTKKNKYGEIPITEAIHTYDPKLVQMLLEMGSPAELPSSDTEDETPLYWAADNVPDEDGDVAFRMRNIIALLLKHGADPERIDVPEYREKIDPIKAKLDLVKEVPLLPGIGVEYQKARDRFEGKTGGKSYKFPRRFTRKHCMSKPCKRMGFTEKASCRPYKNCYRK